MTRQVVAVLGGTGQQGGGVVEALLGAGKFAVRVVSRNPASSAAQALAARGVEVVKADLLDPHGAPQTNQRIGAAQRITTDSHPSSDIPANRLARLANSPDGH
jgi:uncharacterized protein YbjT (DUF2867 family)